jgi:hypothetical protein
LGIKVAEGVLLFFTLVLILSVIHLELDGLGQRLSGRFDVVLGFLEILVELLNPMREGGHFAVDALQLRIHDVVEFVLDDVEFHDGIGAEHGRAKGQNPG